MWDRFLNILKSKIKIVLLLFLAVALLLGYFIGRVNNNKDRVITSLEVALKNNDVKKISRTVSLDDKRVSKEKLSPLVEYYSENTQAIDNDMKQLRNSGDTSAFTIEKKKGVLGDSYNIELKTYDLKVDSNYSDGRFTIDNKNYINGSESMENIVPGVYTINGILKSEYGDIETSKDCVVMKDESVQVNFDAVNITVQSQFTDADVFVNGEYTGMTVGDADNIGPFKDDGTVSIYIEKEFPWGKLKGDETSITDVPVVNLNINMENSKMKKELSSAAEKFYKSVFVALNKEEKSYINAAADDAKDKIYSILEKKYAFLKNKYTVQNIEVMDDKSEYTYEDNMYKANVIVKVSYSTEKSFFGFDKEESCKMFFTKLIYNDESDSWIVDDVENFSL